MSVETATNCWTKAQASVMTALAHSADFRAIVKASTVSEAGKFIFGEQVGDPESGHVYSKEELLELRHYAQVYSADEQAAGFRDKGGGRHLWSGTLVIYIDRLVTDYEQGRQEQPLEVERWFENRIGNLMGQVADYMRENSGPQVSSIIVSEGPGFNNSKDWDSNGMWQGIELMLTWGYV